MGRVSKTNYCLTKKQKAFADLRIEGESGIDAIAQVFDVANRNTASSMSHVYTRHPAIQAYIQKKLSSKVIVDESLEVLLRSLKAKKYVRNDDGYIEVDDHATQMTASKEVREVLKEAERQAPTTGEEDDNYHRNWFIHENGREPTPLELRKFKDVIDVIPEDVRIHALRSEKIAVSLMPKDFIKDGSD